MRPHGPLGSRSASPLGFRRLLEPNQRERGSICQPHTLYKIPLEFGCGANLPPCARKPCLKALNRETCLPSGVVGPVERSAFFRFASLCLTEVRRGVGVVAASLVTGDCPSVVGGSPTIMGPASYALLSPRVQSSNRIGNSPDCIVARGQKPEVSLRPLRNSTDRGFFRFASIPVCLLLP
jgi:hypothetical protein